RSRCGAVLGGALSGHKSRRGRSPSHLGNGGPEDLSRSEGDGRARSAADAVARASYGKLVAFLSARTRDVSRAEDALADAFASALADWPVKGVPTNPEAWLMTVARRKLIDGARRQRTSEAATEDLQLLADEFDA